MNYDPTFDRRLGLVLLVVGILLMLTSATMGNRRPASARCPGKLSPERTRECVAHASSSDRAGLPIAGVWLGALGAGAGILLLHRSRRLEDPTPAEWSAPEFHPF